MWWSQRETTGSGPMTTSSRRRRCHRHRPQICQGLGILPVVLRGVKRKQCGALAHIPTEVRVYRALAFCDLTTLLVLNRTRGAIWGELNAGGCEVQVAAWFLKPHAYGCERNFFYLDACTYLEFASHCMGLSGPPVGGGRAAVRTLAAAGCDGDGLPRDCAPPPHVLCAGQDREAFNATEDAWEPALQPGIKKPIPVHFQAKQNGAHQRACRPQGYS